MRAFREALTRGHLAETRWVLEQQAAGLSVANGEKVHEASFSPTADRHQAPDAAAAFRVEIKERNLRFTSPEDYPFATAFLNNVARTHMDDCQPLIYVLVSQHTGKWVWVNALDRDETWRTKSQRDTTRGISVLTLECPKRFLRPAAELQSLLLPHSMLRRLDGRADGFIGADDPAVAAGTGEAAKRKRIPTESTN